MPADLIEAALEQELAVGEVIASTVDDRACVFLARLYRAEQAIAERLRALGSGRPPWRDIDPDAAIPWVQRKTGLVLAESQTQALRLALSSKVLVITGGPGVGKITLVHAILTVLRARQVEVAVCAPTGRAAKRLSESTGLAAKTIHRLLETDPRTGGFRRGEEHPLDGDLLVIDETSMVDVLLMRSLLRALPHAAALLIIGDVDQLPSVGPGQVLTDIIGSQAVPVVRLTEVFRQAAQSRVIVNAHRINRGLMPELSAVEGSDFYFVDAAEPEEALRKLVAIVRERIPARFGLDPIRDVQVLCPMNRGGLGARALNGALQAALNPPGEQRVERFGWTYAAGDKVMQIVNDYDRDVYNGDLGVVARIDVEQSEIVVRFDDHEVVYGFGELDELVLAYATTIHKSQGSEYPAVVIPLTTQHYTMLARNLLYTGVTRGKRLVVLLGQRKALAIAVRNGGTRRRWSKLREWLRDGAPIGLLGGLIPTALIFDRCPFACGDGDDPLGVADEAVPGVAAGVNDGEIVVPHGHAEAVAAEIFPHVLHRVEFGCIWWQRQETDILRHGQPPAGLVPTGAVADDHAMCIGADPLADFSQMDAHCLAADPRHDDGGADGPLRADRAEQIGRVMPVVANRRRAGAAQPPDVGQRALLADFGFILKPNLDLFARRCRRQDLGYTGGEVFLKAACASASFFG